ncbi:MAG: OsmC family protein [Chloroflexi bacterium]|nr:OsmC family protein [Chloroflexota bacterium]
MGQVKLKWVENRQFVATDSSKHSVVLSSQDPENGTGMRPAELLLVALGGCAAYDVVGILEKKRQPLKGLELHITGEQDTNPPWAFQQIHIEYVAHGEDLSETALAQAIKLSEEKYCSVSATLSGVAEITSSFRIVPE